MFTRWKINSIGYGHRVLGAIGILVIAIPLALYLCSWALGLFGVKSDVVFAVAKISFTVGMVLLALFVLLLTIEFAQDRFLDTHYSKMRNRKLKLANGQYECQYCGTQRVRESDKHCPICGKDLK